MQLGAIVLGELGHLTLWEVVRDDRLSLSGGATLSG